jgi:hypothetical protein
MFMNECFIDACCHLDRPQAGTSQIAISSNLLHVCYMSTEDRRMYSPRTGQARLGYRPSKKSIKRIVEKIHAPTDQL